MFLNLLQLYRFRYLLHVLKLGIMGVFLGTTICSNLPWYQWNTSEKLHELVGMQRCWLQRTLGAASLDCHSQVFEEADMLTVDEEADMLTVEEEAFTHTRYIAHTTTFKEVKSLCELHGLQLWRAICERIWEKGPLHAETEFLFLIAHNFKAVIVTDFKPGIMKSTNVLNPRWN